MIADSERHVCMIIIVTKSEMHRDWNDNWGLGVLIIHKT